MTPPSPSIQTKAREAYKHAIQNPRIKQQIVEWVQSLVDPHITKDTLTFRLFPISHYPYFEWVASIEGMSVVWDDLKGDVRLFKWCFYCHHGHYSRPIPRSLARLGEALFEMDYVTTCRQCGERFVPPFAAGD